VHSSIPAFSNFDEFEEDLAVARDPALRPEEERDLRLGEAAGLTGLYCQQCAACLPQCPKGVQVPELMRAYMYAVGHGRPGHARRALRAWAPSDIHCTTCSDCTVRCALGFDVRARARDLARLMNA
jgi:predicted aldo/keto reductase-like oxidoreductase